jgi:ankyrin repeat protein
MKSTKTAGSQTRPIFEAIRTGNFRIFTDLLNADPRLVMARDENGWTALHCIAAMGSSTTAVHAMMTKRLISEAADVNCRTVLGWTPIHMIAMQGQKEAVDVARILIDAGADLNALDNDGKRWSLFWQHGDEIRDILVRAEIRKGAH